jgi:hypothetical protein
VWGYNARNELTGSQRYNSFDPNDPNSPSDPNHAFDRAYAYDPIGNRTSYTEGTSAALYYCANNLNQYETTDETSSCPPNDPNESFSYDADGNLTEVGGIGVSPVSYTWNAENRLIGVAPASSPVNGDKKLEFR